MSRIEYFIGDGTLIPWVIKHDGTPVVIDAADTIKVKVLGEGWESAVNTVDTAETGSDLPSGRIVIDPANWSPWEDWAAGQVTWEIERTPTGTSRPQTYQYTNAVVKDDNL